MIDLLNEIAKKYQLQDLETELRDLNKPIPISIGFLGEFNSGKSTLINALIGSRLMPAMEIPASKSIVEIELKDNLENTQFAKRSETGETIKISEIEFNDIALGKKAGTAICQIQSHGILESGFKLIDTPGLENLDDMDKDITFGYLQFLDGAVICWDIQRGSLTESFYEFLKKRELLEIKNNFLFVLTKASTISPPARESIRLSLIKGLKNQSGLEISELDSKVTYVDSEDALDGKLKESNLEIFIESMNTNLIKRREELANKRAKIQLKKIAERTAYILEDRLNNFKLTPSEFDTKKDELTKKQHLLEERINSESNKLQSLKKELDVKIAEILGRYKDSLATSDGAKRKDIISNLLKEMQNTISNSTKTYFVNLSVKLDDFSSSFDRLNIDLKKIDDISEYSKSIATGVITTIALPGSSAMVKTGQFLGTSVVSKISKFIRPLSEVMKSINPVELIADIISNKIKEGKVETSLPNLASQVSNNVKSQLEILTNAEVLTPIRIELAELSQSLESARKDKLRSIEDQARIKNMMIADINNLRESIKNSD